MTREPCQFGGHRLARSVLLAVLIAPAPSVAAELESPEEIIAAEIRRAGLPCKNPQHARRDREKSRPDHAVWILECERGTYRVKLTPNLKAEVERIE